MPAVLTPSQRPASAEKLRLLSDLPPLPTVALSVMQLLSKDGVHMDSLAALLRNDPAFTAELLRVANSPLYSLSFQVSTVAHAASVLGFDFVRSLAMTTALRSYLAQALRIDCLRRVWRHSLATAMTAEVLASACRLNKDVAFTAGLLHRVGQLALLAGKPAKYAEVLECADRTGSDLAEAERAAFHLDHQEAGHWLAQEWKLPEDLRSGLAVPNPPAEPEFNVPAAIRLADRLADALGFRVLAPRFEVSVSQLLEAVPAGARSRLPDEAELAETISARLDSMH